MAIALSTKRANAWDALKKAKKAEAISKVFCDIYSCARDKQLATCSDCVSYPCEKYDKGIFSESFIKWVREKLKEHERGNTIERHCHSS